MAAIENYELKQSIFTEADYQSMDWHDSAVRGIGILSTNYELAFDIDYIFEWIPPVVEGGYYNFWIAPVTLVFARACQISMEIRSIEGLHIDSIIQSESNHKRPNNTFPEWLWTLRCNDGDISLLSSGFRQYTRRKPILSSAHYLSMEQRGGFCFDTPESPTF